MFARLLIMTKAYELAAIQAALQRRTVIKLSPEEWAELHSDLQFRRAFPSEPYVINNVVVTSQNVPPKS